MSPREIAEWIVADLFVTGSGEEVDRLVLTDDSRKHPFNNRGGWARGPALDRIEGAIKRGIDMAGGLATVSIVPIPHNEGMAGMVASLVAEASKRPDLFRVSETKTYPWGVFDLEVTPRDRLFFMDEVGDAVKLKLIVHEKKDMRWARYWRQDFHVWIPKVDLANAT